MKKILLMSLFLLSTLLHEAMAQDRTVTGRVTEAASNQGLPGVTVLVQGTQVGTSTDVNGNYSIKVPASGTTLVFSFIGYTTIERPVGNATAINVSLGTDAKALNEVVVIGAGGIERQVKEQGYKTTQVTSQELTQGRSPNVATGLTGKVAGLQINAVSSGLNPNVRVVLRGNRSMTGNNQALIVIDNVIVPSEILGNLNPEDIENISVLTGASGAALYGSAASNGAIIITTKKGRKGSTDVRVAHTTTLEQVSFSPKLQNTFGSGYAEGIQGYVPYENQQYGPAFDGSMVQIGKPLADGSIQTVPYSARNDKYDFWETGVQNQTDFSLSSGTEKSTFFISGQRYAATGTTPGDEYKRVALRANASTSITEKLKLNISTSYTQNDYDITTATSAVYDNLLNTPAHIPLLNYSDWQTDPFANPNGYYNEYYQNPYFAIDNNRRDEQNNYLLGNVELKYAPLNWLDFTYRVGLTNRNYSRKDWQDVFTYTDYTHSISASKNNVAGAVYDEMSYNRQLTSEFQTQFTKDLNDFNFRLILGNQTIINNYKGISTTGTGLVNPGLFNISNRVGEAVPAEGNYLRRDIGVYADFTVGFRDYLFVHATGRNDWTSILAKENRSFFYPAVDIAFTATEAIPALKDNPILSSLKLRGALSKVGQVNLGSTSSGIGGAFGTYALLPTFTPSAGFPFGSLTGYSAGNTLVSPNLEPEFTKGYEFGADFSLLNNAIDGAVTYYFTSTTNQTVVAGVSSATGYTGFRTNTGEVTNKGIETVLHYSPINTENFGLTFGGNYTYNKGEVVSISSDLPRINLSTGASGQVYAAAGNLFPVLIGSDYLRDTEGRIIVDRTTGLPSIDPDQKVLGNTEPLHRLGLNFEFRFLKNFRLTSLFEYRGSYYRYHTGGSTFDFSGASYRSASFNRDRFVIPNSSVEDADNPGTYIANTNITTAYGGPDFWTSGTVSGAASTYVTSGDYWRWREASLSYTVPSALLTRTKFIKAASISLQGRNLWLYLPKSNQWTDPDYNFTDTNAIGITSLAQTPPTRYYGATISVNF